MKKGLSLFAIVLFLSACTQITPNEVPTDNVDGEDLNVSENITSYNNEELNISFDYPSDWDVIEENSTVGITSPNDRTIFRIPGESPAEFEDRNSEYIQKKLIEEIELDKKSPTDSSGNYSVKGYLGHEGQHYIIEMNGNYINLSTDEFDLFNDPPEDNSDKAQRDRFKKNLDLIINSVSF